MAKRKGINSRTKGATFERDVAKLLTTWCGMNMRRSPMSGGWNKHGDITPVDPHDMDSFKFNVECKNQMIWDFSDLIKDIHNNDGIESWWIQAANDAEKSKRVPLLIFTKNRHPNYIMLTENLYKRLAFVCQHWGDISYKTLRWCQFRIMLLEDFLHVDYKKAARIAGKIYFDEYIEEAARNN